LFYLGSCYRKLEQWREATRVWERALQEEAEVAQASALALSEVRLLGPKPATALECFDVALRNLNEPGSFRNSLLEPGEARQLVETGVRNFLKQRDFKNSHHLAQLLEKIPPGTNREILGEVFDAWARDCLNRDRAEDALSHFRDAAAAYAALGDSLTTPAEKAKWYRLGSDRYLLGKNPARAAAVQKSYLAAETAPERLGEGWFTLAEIYRTLHNKSSARAAFHKAIEYPGPSAFRARYQLALMEIEEAKLENDSAKLEDAQTALQQNLDLMRTNPEPETHENTLRALADLLIYRGNFKLAAIRLEETVDRYPRNTNSAQTRKLLADCYRRLASKEDQKLFEGIYVTKETQLHYREQRRHWLQKALAHYQKLVDDLRAEGRSRQLTPQEETILQQAGFAVAECHFEQGLYPEAIQHFEKLVQQYARQAEALQALKQIARCYWVMNNQAKAGETVERVRQALRDTPDKALNGSPDIPSRKEWQEWLDWAAKQ
jgi:tetratricopeptide (TPR) repeat protein